MPKTAKKSAKKSVKKTAAKATKKTSKKKVAPSKNGQRETVRVRALKALRKAPLTASEVQAPIGLNHGLKPTLENEVERGNLRHVGGENGKTTFSITAAGKKAIEKGTVNPARATA